MRVWILSALWLLLVSAAPKGNGAEDKIVAPVVSPSNSEILLACTSGLPFGDTLETAFAYCDKTVGKDRLASLRLGQGKGGIGKGGNGKGKSGKGKGGKCPSVSEVLENL